MAVVVRPLEPEDFGRVAGAMRPPYRVKGWAGVLDGEPIAIGGVAYTPQGLLLWSHLTDTARAHPVTLLRAARRFLAQTARETRQPIIAFEDNEVEAAGRFLARLGFAFLAETNDTRIWQWRN